MNKYHNDYPHIREEKIGLLQAAQAEREQYVAANQEE